MEQWKIWLVVAHGPNEGDTVPVSSDQFLIGQRASCHFRPVGEGVADLHCALLVREGRLFLRNFRRPDGTSVGGRQVLGGIELRDGDRFQVGDWQLQARIARRTRPVVEPVPSEAERSAAAVPATLCDVGWSASSASSPGRTTQFFVACTGVFPLEELLAPADVSPVPVASDATCYLPATGCEIESAAGEDSGAHAEVIEAALPTLPPMVESAPGMAAETGGEAGVSDETSSLLAAACETESAAGEDSGAHGDMIEAALPPVEESAPGTETVTHEETAYLPFAAQETASATATPAVRPNTRRASLSYPIDSCHIETGLPAAASPPPGPKGRRLLVARLDRAMPTLRRQEWDKATKPKESVPAAPRPKTWKNWLPALGGVVVGMVLVGAFFLTALRAASGPLPTPPRGRLHTGRTIVVQEPVYQGEEGPHVGQRRTPIQADPQQGPLPQDGPRVRRRPAPPANP